MRTQDYTLSSTDVAAGHSHSSPVLSAIRGTNADLMHEVARLWLRADDYVVDVTFGKGRMWRRLPGLPTIAHDLATDGVDLRALPHADASADVIILDPPYRPTHSSKGFSAKIAADFGLGTSAVNSMADVLSLYRDGAAEAYRVLRKGGRILVKCQDMAYNHRLHFVTTDVANILRSVGFGIADQFILVNEARMPSSKWVTQERARRAHSVLWVAVK